MIAKLNQIRAHFATWLCDKGFFHTLALAAQANYRLDSNLSAIASISLDVSGFSICLRPSILKLFDVNPEAMYFILMHELRHVRQFQSIHSQDQLLSLAPIDELLLKKAPIAKRAMGFKASRLKEFKDYIINVAADAALHEDLLEIFGENVLKDVERFDEDAGRLGRVTRQSITVERLNIEFGLQMQPKQDWLYYAKALVRAYADHLDRNDEDFFAFLSGAIAPGLPPLEMDHHAGTFTEKVQEILVLADREKERLIKAQAHSQGYRDQEPGEDQQIFENRRLLNDRIKVALKLIAQKVGGLNRSQYQDSKSFRREHRAIRGLPGSSIRLKSEGNALDVLVIDVSGSMWTPTFMEQMLSLARHLESTGQIKALYSCDVKLRQLPLRSSGLMEVQGGGGTCWTRDHNLQLLNDFKMTKGLRILYCTDEDVDGLTEARQDSRVELFVMNIPKLLFPS